MPPQVESAPAPGALETTFKSRDVEAYIDIVFYRPVGFRLAQWFAKLNLTPNAVSAIGCVVGLIAGHLYYYSNIGINVVGMVLHVLANALDNADGQLARITGIRNPFGRIVDGVADHLVFAGIYLHLSLRCAPELGWSLTAALVISAAISHGLQSAAADYFRGAYLILNGAGEADSLDSSEAVRAELNERSWRAHPWQKLLLIFYRSFVLQQEMIAPRLRRLRVAKRSLQVPQWLGAEYRRASGPLIKWLNALMTNPRMLILFAVLLIGQPAWYFVAEMTVLNAILVFVVIRHDAICRDLLARFPAHGGD